MATDHHMGLEILGCLLLIFICILSPLHAWWQNRRCSFYRQTALMQGLFYRLENGTVLLIGRHWLPEKISRAAKAIVNQRAEVRGIINQQAFEQVCKEPFNPQRLFIKPIAEQASVYPLYRNSGIEWHAPL